MRAHPRGKDLRKPEDQRGYGRIRAAWVRGSATTRADDRRRAQKGVGHSTIMRSPVVGCVNPTERAWRQSRGAIARADGSA